MVKINEKDWKKIKKIKKIKIFPSIREESLNKKGVEKKSENLEGEINDLKFLEFLTPSINSTENLASRKSRSVKPIERNEEVLSFIPKEEEKKEKKEIDYSLQINSKDYKPFSPREEKKQNILTKSFQPQRVDFNETGRDTRMQLREVFFQENEMNRLASSRRGSEEERKYNVDRVDLTEIGREKRYKLMK
jgi:hypothetical protein